MQAPMKWSLGALAGVTLLFISWRRYTARAVAWWEQQLKLKDISAAQNRLHSKAEELASSLDGHTENLPPYVDIVISGGGFKVSYAYGILVCAQAVQRRFGKLNFVRYSAASAGAQMAYCATQQRPQDVANDGGALTDALRWALCSSSALQRFPLMHPEPLWGSYFSKLVAPYDVPPPGQLTVSITELRFSPRPTVRNKLVSAFQDKEDLSAALRCTGGIPCVLIPGPWTWFRGMRVVDGGITDNCPVFKDHVRPQIVIKFFGLPKGYDQKLFRYTEEEVEDLAMVGMQDLVKVLKEANDIPLEERSPTFATAAIASPTMFESPPPSSSPATVKQRKSTFAVELLDIDTIPHGEEVPSLDGSK